MGHHKKHHKHRRDNENLVDLNQVDMSQLQNMMQNIDMNQLSSMLSNLSANQPSNNIPPMFNNNMNNNNVLLILSTLRQFLPRDRQRMIDRILESFSNINF